ncbi:MAG TPA: DUF2459 domain-containing protein [Campylobacteraceae bacterium]|nr:DUF2459 domain-containing protein [Campylobacteraceae bacterium]
MFLLRIIKKLTALLLCMLVLYVAVSLLLMWITPSYSAKPVKNPKRLYLFHDLAHTEIILPGTELSPPLPKVLAPVFPRSPKGFIAFSYGDARFMALTREWSDLDPLLAIKALFTDTPGAIRVGHYAALRNDTTLIPLTIERKQMEKLQKAILQSIKQRNDAAVELSLPHPPYVHYFAASQPYNLFYTCNQWTAQILRSADIPAPLWAPFAFEAVYAVK